MEQVSYVRHSVLLPLLLLTLLLLLLVLLLRVLLLLLLRFTYVYDDFAPWYVHDEPCFINWVHLILKFEAIT